MTVQFNQIKVYGSGNYTFLPKGVNVDIIVPDGIGGIHLEHFFFENKVEAENFIDDVRNEIGAVTTYEKGIF